jgi:hypothetical protein
MNTYGIAVALDEGQAGGWIVCLRPDWPEPDEDLRVVPGEDYDLAGRSLAGVLGRVLGVLTEERWDDGGGPGIAELAGAKFVAFEFAGPEWEYLQLLVEFAPTVTKKAARAVVTEVLARVLAS